MTTAGSPLVEAVRLPATEAARDPRTVSALRTVKVAVVATVLLQRFAIPAGDEQVSLVLPVVGVAFAALVARGHLVEDAARVRAYLFGVGACLVAALVALTAGGSGSLLSVGQLVLLYLPFCFVLTPVVRRHYREVCEFLCAFLAVFAVIGIGQWAAQQLLGWTFEDPVVELVAEDWLLEGFNSFYPVDYGSPIIKPNAVAFLEPSFLSQAMGLGFVVQLLLGGRRLRLVLFAGCMLATVAGTGILLVAVGIALLLLRGGTRRVRLLAAPLLLGVVVLAFTPAGDLFEERSGESSDRQSSAYARFVAPHEVLGEELAGNPSTLLLGRGPGVAEDEAEAYYEATNVPIVFPVVPKLVIEYGLVAAVAFLVFLLAALVSGVPSTIVGGSLLFMSLVLSGALLQPATVLLCWLLSSAFATERAGHPTPAGLRVRAARRPVPGRLPLPG